jgi:hypothetical protein
MLCEAYKQALSDAAAGDDALSPELASHVSACPACRVAFAEEQQLFAAIDSGIQLAANREVPVSLFPRVRAGLDERRVPNPLWLQTGAALGAAALVAAIILFVRAQHRPTLTTYPAADTVAHVSVPKEVGPTVESPVVSGQGSIRPARAKLDAQRAMHGQPTTDVPVIVPAGQKQAVDALIAAAGSGAVKPDALLAEKGEARTPNGELAPLGIPEIQIKPLAAASEESAPTK